MTPQQTQVKEAEQLELDLAQPIKFETPQEAASWLHERAVKAGIDQAVIADIESIGTCDQQSATRVQRYAAELNLDAKLFTW